MIKHVWTIVSSKASIDTQSNNVSLFNVLEQINIQDLVKPEFVLAFNFEVLTCWIRENPETPCKGRQRLAFIDPMNKQLAHIELDINLAQTERARNRFQINSLPLTIPGRYFFRTDLQIEGESDWQTVNQYPLTVQFKTSPTEVEEAEVTAEAVR